MKYLLSRLNPQMIHLLLPLHLLRLLRGLACFLAVLLALYLRSVGCCTGGAGAVGGGISSTCSQASVNISDPPVC
jgi:hypothetical protein